MRTLRMSKIVLSLFAAAMFALPATAADLPDPDGKPADMSKPVKVYILMGQSNMLEFGKVAGDKEGTLEHAVKKEGLYPYLVDDAGNWTERKDVRNVAVMGSGGPGKTKVRKNEWHKVGGRIGVETAIGHYMGQHHDEPVLILKSAIGNRSLGWDLLPPGSPSYEFTNPKSGKTFVYARVRAESRQVGEGHRAQAHRLEGWSPVRRRCRSGEGRAQEPRHVLSRCKGIRGCRFLLVAGRQGPLQPRPLPDV